MVHRVAGGVYERRHGVPARGQPVADAAADVAAQVLGVAAGRERVLVSVAGLAAVAVHRGRPVREPRRAAAQAVGVAYSGAVAYARGVPRAPDALAAVRRARM